MSNSNSREFDGIRVRTRQARIDAGTRAVCDLFAQHKEEPEGERGRNIPAVAFAEAVLDAADAVAPAVGVTVEWLDERIAWATEHLERMGYPASLICVGEAKAFREVRALLAAQRADDAGEE